MAATCGNDSAAAVESSFRSSCIWFHSFTTAAAGPEQRCVPDPGKDQNGQRTVGASMHRLLAGAVETLHFNRRLLPIGRDTGPRPVGWRLAHQNQGKGVSTPRAVEECRQRLRLSLTPRQTGMVPGPDVALNARLRFCNGVDASTKINPAMFFRIARRIVADIHPGNRVAHEDHRASDVCRGSNPCSFGGDMVGIARRGQRIAPSRSRLDRKSRRASFFASAGCTPPQMSPSLPRPASRMMAGEPLPLQSMRIACPSTRNVCPGGAWRKR